MILVIPAIELKNGQSIQMIKGEEGTENLYKHFSSNPLELSKLWRRENAKTIHINDFDSFDRSSNQLNVNSIIYISQAVDIPIQVFSYFQSVEECRFLLQNGVYRVVIDELALIDPDGVRQLIKEFTPYRVIFNINTKNNVINFNQIKKAIGKEEFIRYIRDMGGCRIVYFEEDWMKNGGVNLEKLVEIANETGLKVTINGGITKAEQLWSLKELNGFGVDSVIIGEALYLNCFPCQKIWRLIEAELEPNMKLKF